jgi:hypothetical protein
MVADQGRRPGHIRARPSSPLLFCPVSPIKEEPSNAPGGSHTIQILCMTHILCYEPPTPYCFL